MIKSRRVRPNGSLRETNLCCNNALPLRSLSLVLLIVNNLFAEGFVQFLQGECFFKRIRQGGLLFCAMMSGVFCQLLGVSRILKKRYDILCY